MRARARGLVRMRSAAAPAPQGATDKIDELGPSEPAATADNAGVVELKELPVEVSKAEPERSAPRKVAVRRKPAAAAPNCNPPYTVDARGVRVGTTPTEVAELAVEVASARA